MYTYVYSAAVEIPLRMSYYRLPTTSTVDCDCIITAVILHIPIRKQLQKFQHASTMGFVHVPVEPSSIKCRRTAHAIQNTEFATNI